MIIDLGMVRELNEYKLVPKMCRIHVPPSAEYSSKRCAKNRCFPVGFSSVFWAVYRLVYFVHYTPVSIMYSHDAVY